MRCGGRGFISYSPCYSIVLMCYNGFGLCVRFCLAESSDLSTNVNGKTCTKPVLYEGGISRTTLSSKHVKRKRKNERGKF